MRFGTHEAVLALAASALVTGCGMRKKADEVTDKAKAHAELTGKWAADCRPSDLAGDHGAVLSYDFGATGGFTFVTDLYEEDGCQTAQRTIKATGTYALPDGQGEGSSPLDLTVTGATVAPRSEAAAKAMNDLQYCGFTDWQSGYERSILGASCGDVSVAADTTLRAIFDVRDDVLYLGTPQLLKMPQATAERATSVDLSAPFHSADE